MNQETKSKGTPRIESDPWSDFKKKDPNDFLDSLRKSLYQPTIVIDMNSLVDKSFELEQEILSTWHIVDELRVLSNAIMDDDIAITGAAKDTISNVLLGLTALYELKFDSLFKTFETVHGGVCSSKKTVAEYEAKIAELKSTVDTLADELEKLGQKRKGKKPAPKKK
jgi:hypothetical protein